ncbi:Heavy metal tolerance protein [Coniochaeta hoffmannii]|uniref:Heavy metal tolerance protein n=1 Tax=Coniochaeta hoffmannii TaxID=91930 RepID=A0AA38VSG1_9PEZI|nr:Heavy metal tolerance protein [Coniochaeta hoffmannii]
MPRLPTESTGSGALHLLLSISPLIIYAYFQTPRFLASTTWKQLQRSISVIIPLLFPKDSLDRRRLIALYACRSIVTVIDAVLDSFVPIQLGRTVDRVVSSATSDGFPWRDVIIFVALELIASQACLGLIKHSISVRTEEAIGLNLKPAVYRHLLSLSSDFHDKANAFELSTGIRDLWVFARCTGDIIIEKGAELIGLVTSVLTFSSVFGAPYAGVFVAYMAVVIRVDIWFLTHIMHRNNVSFEMRTRDQNRAAAGLLNWSTVSYFDRFAHEISRYMDALRARRDFVIEEDGARALRTASRQMLTSLGMLAVSLVTLYQIYHGERSTGDFITVTMCWTRVTSLLREFCSDSYYLKFLADAGKILDALTLKPTVRDKPDAPALEVKTGSIEFENVHFSYDGIQNAIRGASFSVDGGTTVALVGETGGGKSTLIKLLYRRYDATSGSIRIDGQDLRHVSQTSLKAQLTIVPQEIALFDDTILDNVRYGNLDISLEEVQAACKLAAIHDRILKMPDGYDTKVGGGGTSTRLSGGEMQRLAIARAVVRDAARIVVLDEAMSSLDSETDWTIQRNLRRWARGRTMVMVAHRLSTISHADLILVVKDGEIAEAGRQRELIEKKGHYYAMWVKQNEGLEAGGKIAAGVEDAAECA